MISKKASDLIGAYVNAKEYYYRVSLETRNLFAPTQRMDTARAEYIGTYQALCNYIAELEAKAGVE